MEFKLPMDFVQIFVEVYKIYTKHGRLMGSITLLILCLHSMLYLFNILSIKPLITDFLVKKSFLLITTPNTPESVNLHIGMKEDIKIFYGVEGIFLLASSMASLLLSIATIFATAITYGGNNISMQDLLLKTIKSWKRPFVTGLYTTLFVFVYFFLFFVILVPLMFIVERPVTLLALIITISILAIIFYTYLAVVWTLAFVISVLEERCGIEALGKAAKIVKGMQLSGFLLNLLVTIVSVILLQGRRLIASKQSTEMQIIIGLLEVNFTYLVNMFLLMAYTVFYYKCKKNHGEAFELQGSTEYVKLPTTPLINENIP